LTKPEFPLGKMLCSMGLCLMSSRGRDRLEKRWLKSEKNSKQ